MSAEFSRKMREIAKRWELLKAEHQDEGSPLLLPLYGLSSNTLLSEKVEIFREPFKIASPAA